jgi:hypothetical protein
MPAYVDAAGRYVGSFPSSPAVGLAEVPTAPADARQVWQFPGWSAVPADARIAPLAFIARFTAAERTAIRAAAAANAELADWLDRARFAREIDLANPVTLAGLDELVAAGLISPARQAAIVEAPVAPEERP